jgi:hypothetical protein
MIKETLGVRTVLERQISGGLRVCSANRPCLEPRMAGTTTDRRVHPRECKYRIAIRHRSADLFIAEELFGSRLYDPPAEVAELLESAGRPLRIEDLGGHIG